MPKRTTEPGFTVVSWNIHTSWKTVAVAVAVEVLGSVMTTSSPSWLCTLRTRSIAYYSRLKSLDISSLSTDCLGLCGSSFPRVGILRVIAHYTNSNGTSWVFFCSSLPSAL